VCAFFYGPHKKAYTPYYFTKLHTLLFIIRVVYKYADYQHLTVATKMATKGIFVAIFEHEMHFCSYEMQYPDFL